MSFFDELKRRNVFRVGIAYVVASWVLLQVVDLVLDNTTAPSWVMHVFMLFVAVGFVAAVIIAWAYEITPEGIRREHEVDRSQSVTTDTGRKLDRIIIGFLLLAVVLLLADRFARPPGPAVEQAPAQAQSVMSAKSIAVLPFADMSQAQDQEWFADGLAEEILNALAKTPDLQVSSRTSAFRYKDTTLDIPAIAAELGVTHILEGSVRRAGDRIRITAQLIRARDGFHVWSENYDRVEADMIAIQEDLALNIARALETTMDPAALAAMTRVGTRSVEAYQEYLRGLNFLTRTFSEAEEGVLYLQAYDHFEQARALDPNFTAAHFQSADFWRVQITPSRTDTGLTDLEPHQALAQFNQRIDQAIATATTETDAQGFKAYKALVEMRVHEAIRLFSAYLLARPNDEQIRLALMDTAGMASDLPVMQDIIAHWHERGLTDFDSALSYANSAYRVIDPSVAADFLLQTLQRWPNHVSLIYQTHRTFLWAGRVAPARQLMDRYNRLNPAGAPILSARQACAEGRRDEVEILLAAMDPDETGIQSARWHLLKLLGRDQGANDELRGIAQSGIPYQIADMLTYPQFDPSPFPSLLAVLERQGIKRAMAVEVPFKCPPPEQTSIADALKVSLKLETGESGNLTGTRSIEAYEHYLQGMSLWHLRTVDSLNQAFNLAFLRTQQDENTLRFRCDSRMQQLEKELGIPPPKQPLICD